jgi:hypothetical protein
MCDCDKKDSSTVPDFTKHGFAGKSVAMKGSQTGTAHSVESLHKSLAEQGILALDISACVSASLNNGQICFNFPVVGNICFPVPVHLPVDASLKVCGEVCVKLIVPTGVKVTLYVNDNPVWNGTVWGSC